MNTITDFFSTLGNYITTIGIADAFDILIVAFLIYQLIRLIRKNWTRNRNARWQASCFCC